MKRVYSKILMFLAFNFVLASGVSAATATVVATSATSDTPATSAPTTSIATAKTNKTPKATKAKKRVTAKSKKLPTNKKATAKVGTKTTNKPTAKKPKKKTAAVASGPTTTNFPVEIIYRDQILDTYSYNLADIEEFFKVASDMKKARRASAATDEKYGWISRNRGRYVTLQLRDELLNKNICAYASVGICLALEKRTTNGQTQFSAYGLATGPSGSFNSPVPNYEIVAKRTISQKEVRNLKIRVIRMIGGKADGIYVFSQGQSPAAILAQTKLVEEQNKQAENLDRSKQTEISKTSSVQDEGQIMGNEVIFKSDLNQMAEAPVEEIYDHDDPNLPYGPGVLHIITPGANSKYFKVKVVRSESVNKQFDAALLRDNEAIKNARSSNMPAEYSAPGWDLQPKKDINYVFNSCLIVNDLELLNPEPLWKIIDNPSLEKNDQGEFELPVNKMGKGSLNCILKDGTRQHVKTVLKDHSYRILLRPSALTERFFMIGAGWPNGAIDILLTRKYDYAFSVSAQFLLTGVTWYPIIASHNMERSLQFGTAPAIAHLPKKEGQLPYLNLFITTGHLEIMVDPDET